MFPDGNARIARFLMNALFAAGGYPWTVIRVDDRTEYLSGLEAARVDGDVRPFAKFIAAQLRAAGRAGKRRSPARRSRRASSR